MTQSPKPSDEEMERARLIAGVFYHSGLLSNSSAIDPVACALQSYGAEQRRLGRSEAFEEAADIAWEHERKRFTGETIGSTAIGNAIQTRAEQERKGGI